MKKIITVLMAVGLGIPAHAILKVDGRFLYDPCGQKIIIRGVEWVAGDVYLEEVAKTGANCVRQMLWKPDERLTTEKLEKKIRLAVENGMFYDVAPWGGASNFVDRNAWFNEPDIKNVLMKWEDYIIIHAAGEFTKEVTYEQWQNDVKKTIDQFRGYGYQCPLGIMSVFGGRDPHPILSHGRELFDYDPEKNIIFGCQMYWGDWYTDHSFNMTIAEGCKEFAALDFPVQVGACPSDCNTDCGLIAWDESWKNELGCLWWSWHGGSKHSLTTNEKFGSWTEKGQIVCVTGEYSIQNTAVRSQWLLNGGECGEVRIRPSVHSFHDVVNYPDLICDIRGRTFRARSRHNSAPHKHTRNAGTGYYVIGGGGGEFNLLPRVMRPSH